MNPTTLIGGLAERNGKKSEHGGKTKQKELPRCLIILAEQSENDGAIQQPILPPSLELTGRRVEAKGSHKQSTRGRERKKEPKFHQVSSPQHAC